MNTGPSGYVLTLTCGDRIGIVACISGMLATNRLNIVTSHQFSEPDSNRFFMRIAFIGEADDVAKFSVEAHEAAAGGGLALELWNERHRPRILLMVSNFGHCLNDLLYRHRIGALQVEIPAVVSNHETFRGLCEAHGIPFIHLPIDVRTKADREEELVGIIEDNDIELVVLARYMQILSPDLCARLSGRAINIHHSFLPSFKGAMPYRQAYERGVKLIGATAHYVTSDLDEGPIIEQEVLRVDHSKTPADLTAAGRDIESLVLARAVQAHVEHRVFPNGRKTVVLR